MQHNNEKKTVSLLIQPLNLIRIITSNSSFDAYRLQYFNYKSFYFTGVAGHNTGKQPRVLRLPPE